MRTINEYRQALRATFGQRKYRITNTGEIHAHGKMPNASAIGWWLYGQVADLDTEYRLFGEVQIYWITSEQWSRDCIEATAAEVRAQAVEWARGSDEEPAEITEDGEYIYANGQRIGQRIKPE